MVCLAQEKFRDIADDVELRDLVVQDKRARMHAAISNYKAANLQSSSRFSSNVTNLKNS